MISLFIGRFQPFHKGHLYALLDMAKKSDKVIIAIGSSEDSHTKDNPLSFDERKEIITQVLSKENITNYDIIPIPDVGSDSLWTQLVCEKVGDFDTVYTGNPNTKRIFEEGNFDVTHVAFLEGINATDIRKKIQEDQDWQSMIPEDVKNYLEHNDLIKRIQST